MKLYTLILFAFILNFNLKAQNNPLKLGEKLPSLHLESVINYKGTNILTDSIKNKIILFYFWSTGCSGCLKKMPELNQIQKDFNGKIQIILVNAQPEYIVKDFWKKNKILYDIELPTVTDDKILKYLFPHIGVPHVVWIGKNHHLRKISGSNDINYRSISEFLAYEKP